MYITSRMGAMALNLYADCLLCYFRSLSVAWVARSEQGKAAPNPWKKKNSIESVWVRAHRKLCQSHSNVSAIWIFFE